MEKLKVEFGNRSGISLGKKILSATDASRMGYRNAQQWCAMVEQKVSQANALAEQLLGREVILKDVALAGILESPLRPGVGKSMSQMRNFPLIK